MPITAPKADIRFISCFSSPLRNPSASSAAEEVNCCAHAACFGVPGDSGQGSGSVN